MYWLHIANSKDRCYVPEIRGWSFAKALCPRITFRVKTEHYIITEADVKLNKWHITIEKLHRKRTKTEQN